MSFSKLIVYLQNNPLNESPSDILYCFVFNPMQAVPDFNWQSLWINLFLAVISAVVSAFVGYWLGIHKNSSFSYGPIKIKKGYKKNTILLIGLGKTGKTCLINTITEIGYETPLETRAFRVVEHERKDEKGKPIKFYFTDYRGQSFIQLISSLSKNN